MRPVSLFTPTYKDFREESDPIVEGMVPDKQFRVNVKILSVVTRPISDGIVPEIVLSVAFRNSRLDNEDIPEGIVP